MFAVYAAEPNAEAPLEVAHRRGASRPGGARRLGRRHVNAASLNMHDIWTLRGVGIKPEQFPMILGCDGAGRLEDGTEVVHPLGHRRPGDRGRRDPRPEAHPAHREAPGHVRRRRGGPDAQRRAPARRADRRAGRGDGHRLAHRLPDAVREVRPAAGADDARAGRVRRGVDGAGAARAARPACGSGSPAAARRSGRWPRSSARTPRSPSGERLPGTRRRRVRDRRRRHVVALDALAQARRRDRRLRARPAARTRGPTCSGCSSCSCGWSAPRWAPATSSRTCSTFVANAGITPEIGLELPMEQAEEGFRAMLDGRDRRQDRVHPLTLSASMLAVTAEELPVREPSGPARSRSTVGHRV